MSVYLAVRQLHIACVMLSVTGFAGRGLWLLSGRSLPRRGWRHWAPHANDTLLLLAAIALTVMSHQYPIVDAWLTAKLLGLVAYVMLGSVALRGGLHRTTRLAVLLAALAAFAYVVSVALSKSAYGFLSWLRPLTSSGGG